MTLLLGRIESDPAPGRVYGGTPRFPRDCHPPRMASWPR